MVTTITHRTELEPSGQAPAPAPAVADDSRWMLLNRWGCRSDSTTSSIVPDDKTAAASRTSWGRPLRVSVSRTAPPAISSICFNRDDACYGSSSEDSDSDSDEEDIFKQISAYYDDDILHVVTAHGDSVLFKMLVPFKLRRRLGFGTTDAATDYFLYRAGGSSRPPSLSLLPACRIAMHDYEGEPEPDAFCYTERVFDLMDTGLLRCGGEDDDHGEVMVAQLQVAHKAPFDTAELCVLRTGCRDWELKAAVPIVHNEGRGRHDLGRWLKLNGAIPAGNRFLCWVNYDRSTLLVCDMAELDNPMLRYMPLPVPVKAPLAKGDEWWYDENSKAVLPWEYCRSIGAVTTGAAAPVLTFVDIDHRTSYFSSAFVVTTWTMALNSMGEPLEWVKEAVLHSEEFWALLAVGHKDIPPRVCLTRPVVSSENPDVVCFIAEDIDVEMNGNKKSWTLKVDMRRKKLTSVVSTCNHNAQPFKWDVSVN